MDIILQYVEEISYVFGGVLVVLYAIFAFNKPQYSFGDENEVRNYGALARPSLPKYMTEPYRYRMFCLLFVLFAVTQYLLLAQLVPVLPGVDSIVDDSAKKELLRAANPLVSALLLLGLVEFVHWPRELLFGFVKKWLHDFAKIPGLARDLFESLCYESLDYDSDSFRENVDELVGDDTVRKDLQRSDFEIGNSRNMLWKWARLCYGIHVIEKWSHESLYGSQLKEVALGWKPLHLSYRDTIDDVEAYRAGRLDEEQAEKLSREIEEMLANCHRLIACLVIMVAKPSEDPLSYIRRAGYKVMPGNRFALHGGEVYRLLMAVIPAVIFFALIYTLIPFSGDGPISWGIEIQRVLRYILGVLIILVFPVLLVLGFKRHMSMERSWRTVTAETPYDSFFDMPLSLYTLLSLLAWAGSTVLMVLTNSSTSSVSDNYELWKMMAVFSFISAITAFFTAYRVDIPPKVYKTRALLLYNRLESALLQGLLTALVVWAGLKLYLSAGQAVEWKFMLMGFLAAVVLNITLFWGKHTHERRRSQRSRVREAVIAILDGVRVDATLTTTSQGGASIQVNRNYVQSRGAEVELIFGDDRRRAGRVVESEGREMHICYAS